MKIQPSRRWITEELLNPTSHCEKWIVKICHSDKSSWLGIMWGEIPNTSGQQFGFVQDNVMANYENNGNRSATNVSIGTGEEFSEVFLRERVSPQRATTKNDIDQKQQEQQQKTMGYNFIQNKHLGINRGENNGGSEFSDFSPGRYAFDTENEYYFNITKRINKEISSPQHRERFSDESNIGRTTSEQAEPIVFSLECSDSKQASSCVSRVTCDSFSRMKFLCSFGGKICPRPNDGKLRYVGGETRIISIKKNLTYGELVRITTGICNQPHTIKYQHPGEDLDALISVSSDEDLHLMIEEYRDLEGSFQRLRIFLLPLYNPEGPSSLEPRTSIQTEANYQYVFAVNSILDSCPHRIYGRENITNPASQANLLGSTMDYSPRFQRETSTSFHPLHIQNGGSPFKMRLESPRTQFLNTQAPFEPRYASHFKDSRNSYKNMYGDIMHVDGHEYNNSNSMDQLVYENLYYLDALSCYNNQPLERFHDHMNNHFTEFNKAYRPPCHDRKLSKEFVNSPSYIQFEANKKSLIANDEDLHFEDLISSQDKGGLFPRKEATTKCQKRITRALFDDQLQGEDGFNLMLEEETNLYLLSQKFGLEKSPSFSGMSEQCSFKYSEDSHKKYLHLKNEKQHLQKREFIQWSEDIEIKKPSFDQDGARHRVCDSNISHSVFFQHQLNLPKINHNTPFSIEEQNFFKENISLLPSPSPENSTDNGIGQPRDHRLRPEIFESLYKSQKETMDHQYTLDNILCRKAPFSDTDEKKNNYSSSSNFNYSRNDDIPFSRLDIGNSLVKEINMKEMHDPYQRREQNPYNIMEKRTSEKHYYEESTFRDETSALYQPVIKNIEATVPESTVIVEDVTCHISHNILSPSTVVPLVQKEPSYQILSSGEETEVETNSIETDNEDVKVDGDIMEEFIDEAAVIELESSLYGLQIINNADLEYLQELGSGNFGTVYHGKWRGTDVAIKRIKKSCFAGRSSEQERLTKDFWRETHILSKLHHPNILAFYGVVPDGPEGTSATVTEFMIDGSLRDVFLRKDRKTLDRRRKVMIVLDAAFGMEYLHMKNIVHFDLKCDNLLVNLGNPQRPVCKVGDFGLSRIKHNTLVSGGVRGTLPWMAPELLNGSSSRVSEKVDVFSFGITMWEILTAKEPYEDMHCGAIIGGIVNNTLRPPIPERCDPEWRKLMEDCWSPEPATRPSFTEITYRLRCMLMVLQPKRYNRTRR